MKTGKRCLFLLIITGLAMTACQEPKEGTPRLTGTVSISGNAYVGQTISADTNSLGGKGGVTFKWKRTGNGAAVKIGTNSAIYVVQAADLGSTITVTVTCSGSSGSKTSSPTAAVILPPLTGTVSVSGIAEPGKTLTASTDSLNGSGDITYQWNRDGTPIPGENSSTYVVQAADAGCTVTVTVTRSGYSGDITDGPTAAVGLPPLTGTVSISGTAHVGQTLTASTGSLGGSGDIIFQWMRAGTFSIGYNSSTYVVQPADLASTITVTVSRDGYSGSKTSEPTAAVPPFLTGTVSISGTAAAGQTLTAVTANLNGIGTISYQWKRDGTFNIGTDSSTYLVQTADVGDTLTVTVTRSGYTGSLTSEPIVVGTLPPLTGTVTITGLAQAALTLTASTARLGGTGTISYQWKRGTTDVGTDSNTYLARTVDVGYDVTVTVTRSGNSGSVVSDAVTIEPELEYFKKVEFTGNATTATVTLNSLSNHSVYLVKVNTSATQVAAANTGSVQSVSPSSLSVDVPSPPLPADQRQRPRMGHPAATEFNANPPPLERGTIRPLAALAAPAVVGDTRMFWVEEYINGWVSRQAQADLLATGTYGNIWVIDNLITTEQAQALAGNFDIIYPAETNLLGYEYGGGPDGHGGMDGDRKIQILVYNIGPGVLGFFTGRDFYENQTLSNKAEIFYLDASWTKSAPELIYLTLAHEFQHMINFNRKTVEKGLAVPVWYNETMSTMTEDIMADIIGIPTTHPDHPLQDKIPDFLDTYNQVGFAEWNEAGVHPYPKGFTFGAYLMRNYGGPDFLRRMLANDTVGIASITEALNEFEPGMTFEKAVRRFGEAMIFSGKSKPAGYLTFDKTVTSAITGYTYTLPAFDIWNTSRFGSGDLGPVVYSTAQRAMRGYTVLVQQGDTWNNRTGSFSVTFNKPANDSVEMYLMIR